MARINRGFYRFGETIAELNIVNHKLMARTEESEQMNIELRCATFCRALLFLGRPRSLTRGLGYVLGLMLACMFVGGHWQVIAQVGLG